METKDIHVVEKSEKGEKGVVEAKIFGNEEGKKVMGFLPVDPVTFEIDPKGDIAFNGEIVVGSNMGPRNLVFEFPEGYTLEKCFEDFDEIAQKEIEARNQEAQEKSRIIIPSQMKGNNGPILTP